MAKIAHTRTSPRHAQTTRDLHYANSTKKLARFQVQLETKAPTKPKIIVIASKIAEQYHLARRGRVTCEEALGGAANDRLQRPYGRADGLSETRDAV